MNEECTNIIPCFIRERNLYFVKGIATIIVLLHISLKYANIPATFSAAEAQFFKMFECLLFINKSYVLGYVTTCDSSQRGHGLKFRVQRYAKFPK